MNIQTERLYFLESNENVREKLRTRLCPELTMAG